MSLDPDHPVRALDQHGLEMLDREECLQLLADSSFGRVGVTLAAMPVILPVNFRLVAEQVVFRTSPGTKLDAAVRNAVLAFEVDDVHPVSHGGWSVLVTGIAEQVVDPDEVTRLSAAHVPRWTAEVDDHFVTIPTTVVTGRRLRSNGSI